MPTVVELAKIAAEKQAFAPILRSVAKPLLNRTGQFASSLIRPTFKPKPEFVSQAAAHLASNPPGTAAKVLNYVANVPTGELFRQRPIRNTANLLKFDGLPLMRQLGRVSVGGAGLYGLHNVNETNKWLDKNLQNTADVLESKLNPAMKTNFDWKSALLGAKKDLLYDQTLGAMGRYFSGNDNLRQQQLDSSLRDVALNEVARNLQPGNKEKQNFLGRLKQWRNPKTVATATGSSLAQNLLPKPKPANQVLTEIFNRLRESGLEGQPTSVEQILEKRFGPAVKSMTPEAKKKFYAGLLSAAASAAAASAAASSR